MSAARPTAAGVAERLLARLLPPRAREPVLGDLHEERAALGAGPWWVAARLAGVAAHFQSESWHEPTDRAALAALAFAAGVLLWVVPEAARALLVGAAIYTDPVSRAALAVWRESHLVAAVAAGLLVGGLPFVPERARAGRWHVALLLAAFAGIRDASVAAPLALVLATSLAGRARPSTLPPGAAA